MTFGKPALPPRYTQFLKVEFSSHVPLGAREEKIINLAIQRACEGAGCTSPLADAAFNPAHFTKAVKNV